MSKIIHIAWLLICCSALLHAQSYEEALRKLQARGQTLQTYTCVFTSFAHGPEASEEVTYRYYFKKPQSIRMDAVTGPYEGTVLLYNGGKVRVKPGHGIFSWFTFSFEPSNRYIVDPRGNGVPQSSWSWYIDQHILMLPLTHSKALGDDTVNGRQALKFELTSTDPGKTGLIAVEQLWIDAHDFVLLQYRQYDSAGVLLQSGLYQDIVIDSPLDERLFTEMSRENAD